MTRHACRREIPFRVKRAVLDEWIEPDWDTVYCFHCLEEGGPQARIYETCRLPAGFEWDHLIPVAKGGANTAENIVISCRKCNRSKGARTDWISPYVEWGLKTGYLFA